MKLIPLGLSATAIALITATAIAGPWGGGHPGKGGDPEQRREMFVEHLFERLDTNGDDQITPEEREASREQRFKANDTNGDGQISYDEFRTQKLERSEKRWKRQFERMDTNSDGGVTMAEKDEKRGKRQGRMLEHVDQNGDGIITREEAMTAEPPQRGHGKGKGECQPKR